jgi:hypothetical protein
MANLELWAAPEAAFSRAGDHYFDRLQRSGFAQRSNVLDCPDLAGRVFHPLSAAVAAHRATRRHAGFQLSR